MLIHTLTSTLPRLQESTLSDVHRRKEALAVLTAYHPFWLAVGLQTVLGKALVLSPGALDLGGTLPGYRIASREHPSREHMVTLLTLRWQWARRHADRQHAGADEAARQ